MEVYRMLAIASVAVGLTQAQDQSLPTFGTTVYSSLGFHGQIYHMDRGRRKLPNFKDLKPVGTIYTNSLNVPYRDFKEGFPGITQRYEYFAIDYMGKFWVDKPGYYRFELTSDDGSKLYLDGKQVINNDKEHPVETRAANVRLASGAHQIRVSYFQGPRWHVALVLKVAAPDESEYQVFNTDNFKPPIPVQQRQ